MFVYIQVLLKSTYKMYDPEMIKKLNKERMRGGINRYSRLASSLQQPRGILRDRQLVSMVPNMRNRKRPMVPVKNTSN